MYYAVKNGKNITLGILNNWGACEKEISGVKSVEFKKFKTIEEAQDFLFEKELKKESVFSAFSVPIVDKKNEIKAYVDGSFTNGQASYGVALIQNDTVIAEDFGITTLDNSMRNVSGELAGAMAAVDIAYRKGYEKVTIHYDYSGIEDWVTGAWKAKKHATQEYSEYMKQMLHHIEIEFVKVKGHSGDKWNDYVDGLAAKAFY